MRLFIAIPLPEALKEEIYSRVRQFSIPGVKLVEKENYHLTLLFLGDTDEQELDSIKQVLDNLNYERIELTLTNTGFFPSYKPRVIWIGVNNKEYLETIHNNIVNGLGIMPDKPFKPHITIARLKYFSNPEKIIDALNPLLNKSFIADRIILYQSTLTRNGPIYKELFVKNLK